MLAALALAVTVRTLEGAFEDELVSLDGRAARFIGREVPREDLLSLDWPERGAGAAGPHAVLIEGGYVLHCGISGLEDDVLLTRGPFTVPLESASAVVFAGGRPAARHPTKDLLLLVSGDELRGVLTGVGERGLVFESKLGAREYRFGELRALVTSSRLARAPGGDAAVELADGSLLPFESFELGREARGVALGAAVSLPGRDVARVSLRPPGAVELSEWEEARYAPASAAETALFAPRRGRNVLSRAPRMGGRTFLDGVGERPPARIEWRLPKGAGLLRCLCGLDDAALGRGNASARFLADGREVWSGDLEGGRVLDVAARLDGARTLELFLEEGADGSDEADYVDVVELFVVKEEEG